MHPSGKSIENVEKLLTQCGIGGHGLLQLGGKPASASCMTSIYESRAAMHEANSDWRHPSRTGWPIELGAGFRLEDSDDRPGDDVRFVFGPLRCGEFALIAFAR
jgi:hypothetical protein